MWLVERVTDSVPWVVTMSKVVEALMVVSPVVGEVMVTLQVPAAVWQSSRLLAVPPQLLRSSGVVKVAVAPRELVRVKTTQVPLGAATKPRPSPLSCWTVAVRVWVSLTSFTSEGAMAMEAWTQRLRAGPELGATPLVERVRLTPETLKVVEALMVVNPVVGEVMVTLQVPAAVWQSSRLLAVPPQLLRSSGVVKVAVAPRELVRVKTTQVPLGAATKPRPSPLSCWTVAVRVWVSLTSFTSEGAMAMEAWTQ